MKGYFFDEGSPKWVSIYRFAVLFVFLVFLISLGIFGFMLIRYGYGRNIFFGVIILVLDIPVSLGQLAFNLLILNLLEIGQKRRNEICGKNYLNENKSNKLPEL